MRQTLEAVFEDGVFRPLVTPSLTEGQRVRLAVEPETPLPPEEILRLAESVYEGLSAAEIAEVEAASARRSDFFRAEAD